MKQYFAAYKHDLKTLKEIWDKTPKMFDDWFFNDFTTRYKNICWTITNNKITGYCNKDYYKYNSDRFVEVDKNFFNIAPKKDNPPIMKACQARKMLNENLDARIETILEDINLSIENAIKNLKNSTIVEFTKVFCNIIDILEEAGYILSQKEDEDYIILEISW